MPSTLLTASHLHPVEPGPVPGSILLFPLLRTLGWKEVDHLVRRSTSGNAQPPCSRASPFCSFQKKKKSESLTFESKTTLECGKKMLMLSPSYSKLVYDDRLIFFHTIVNEKLTGPSKKEMENFFKPHLRITTGKSIRESSENCGALEKSRPTYICFKSQRAVHLAMYCWQFTQFRSKRHCGPL